jgi:adenine-specific DNA-methyltransferase
MTTQTYGVKYIGSKNSLVGEILSVINTQLKSPETLRCIDVFTGTTRVAQAFRSSGWTVQSSDLSWASEAYAHAFLLRTEESGGRIPALLHTLQDLSGMADWLTNTYCDVSGVEGIKRVRMWKPVNGIKADAIRNKIAEWELSAFINHHEAMILTSCLIFALDKVDSSTGVQQAYLKDWAARASNPLRLEDLPFHNGVPGRHAVGDCLQIMYNDADIAYLDPPYSAHSYSTYYHIWDSITRWDKPSVHLTTNRRADRVVSASEYDEGMKSAWNSKSTALEAFISLCSRLPVKYILISYNNESLIPLKLLTDTLRSKFGDVVVREIAYKRNIMSQIGNATLYNDEFKTENTEVLIWVKRSV